MRIISKFKDYYDYVGGMYYDTDDKVIYNRDKIKKPESHLFREYSTIGAQYIATDSKDNLNYRLERDYRRYQNLCRVYLKTLVVCGIGYPLYFIDIEYDFYGRETCENINRFRFLDGEGISKLSEYDYTPKSIESLVPTKNDKFVELSRQINSPVFILHDTRNTNNNFFKFTHNIGMEVPNLLKLGFNKIKKAEILYQELEYFIGSILPGHPDSLPIPSIPFTDKDRILNAGFDLKQSFRHRK